MTQNSLSCVFELHFKFPDLCIFILLFLLFVRYCFYNYILLYALHRNKYYLLC